MLIIFSDLNHHLRMDDTFKDRYQDLDMEIIRNVLISRPEWKERDFLYKICLNAKYKSI